MSDAILAVGAAPRDHPGREPFGEPANFRVEVIMRPERIVVGVDFSPASYEAANWAARHLGRGTELILAHVIAIPEAPPVMRNRYPRRDLVVDTVREGADKRLRGLSRALPSDRIWLEIREGDVAAGLADIATTSDADMLVIGAHSERPGLGDGLGSTAERLVRTAKVPVMLVSRFPVEPPTRILVPVDDSAVAPEALRWAAALGERLEARLTSLHVVTSGVVSHALAAVGVMAGAPVADRGAFHPPLETGDHWLDLAARAGVRRDRIRSEIAYGEPAREIIAAAERMNAGLIVMGRRGAGAVRRAVLGSVVDEVMRHAPCPVLVVGDAVRPGVE